MEPTRLTFPIWLVILVPLIVSVVLPLNRRIMPKYPLAGSSVLYGFVFTYAFFLLMALPNDTIAYGVSYGPFRIGYHIDQISAAALVIISVISWKTILVSPRLWNFRDGFVSLFFFSLSTVALIALILSDNLLLFIILWTVLDIGAFYGREWDTANSLPTRWRSFLLLQSASYLVLGAVTALNTMAKTTSFTALVEIGDRLSPTLLTFVLSAVFLSAGIKVAGFPASYFSSLAAICNSRLPHIPMLYGIGAVLPGIYLLTRIHPLLDLALVPSPILIGSAFLLGLFVFPLFNRA